MASLSSPGKTIPASLSTRDHPLDSVGLIFNQSGCLPHNQVQMFGSELGLMEISEAEYAHLQHLIHTTAPDVLHARSPPASVLVKDDTGSTMMSPSTTSQAIDLSTSTDEHCLVMSAEKTPVSHGEVPDFVLAKVINEESPTEKHHNRSASSLKQTRSAARVCLEKRFSSMSADTPRQQDYQSSLFTNFVTILQQSEAQETTHPQIHKWLKIDRAKVIGRFPHMAEAKCQGLIFPQSVAFNCHHEKAVSRAPYASSCNSAMSQQSANTKSTEQHCKRKHILMLLCTLQTHRCIHFLFNVDISATSSAVSRKHGNKAALDSAGKSGRSKRKRPHSEVPPSQRREVHNSKERERRKKIRSCCDELNMLVPFCDSRSDKATTLQWTTAFLRYMNETYGDTLKEEFKNAITKSNPSSGHNQIHQEMDEALSIPLTAEQ
ncbi:uncharacterized protein V6R79_017031 [Siganus canaliculatus]